MHLSRHFLSKANSLIHPVLTLQPPTHHTSHHCLHLLWQASEQGRPPEHTSKFYAKGALQYLVPILTQTLTKQVQYGSPLQTSSHSYLAHYGTLI